MMDELHESIATSCLLWLFDNIPHNILLILIIFSSLLLALLLIIFAAVIILSLVWLYIQSTLNLTSLALFLLDAIRHLRLPILLRRVERPPVVIHPKETLPKAKPKIQPPSPLTKSKEISTSPQTKPKVQATPPKPKAKITAPPPHLTRELQDSPKGQLSPEVRIIKTIPPDQKSSPVMRAKKTPFFKSQIITRAADFPKVPPLHRTTSFTSLQTPTSSSPSSSSYVSRSPSPNRDTVYASVSLPPFEESQDLGTSTIPKEEEGSDSSSSSWPPVHFENSTPCFSDDSDFDPDNPSKHLRCRNCNSKMCRNVCLRDLGVYPPPE